MPVNAGVPPGTLMMLVLRVLTTQPLHGYAIAQRIHQLSADELRVEEGSLYPTLQKLLIKGWVKAAWRESDSGRQVREYRITTSGRRQLEAEMTEYRRTARAIGLVLDEG
jgi:PadR family transcriptional regulator, regulatory protein PadR